MTTIGLSSLVAPFLASCAREEGHETGSDAIGEQRADDGLVDLLFVQESEGVRFEGDGMVLANVRPQTLFFSDRPEEIAGYLSFNEFLDLVGEGPDNFQEDPPNATLVIMEGNDLVNVVMNLTEKPRLEGKDLVFPSIKIIQGEPPVTGGTSALFIDTVGRPASPGSVAGVHRRHRRRHRRKATHR